MNERNEYCVGWRLVKKLFSFFNFQSWQADYHSSCCCCCSVLSSSRPILSHPISHWQSASCETHSHRPDQVWQIFLSTVIYFGSCHPLKIFINFNIPINEVSYCLVVVCSGTYSKCRSWETTLNILTKYQPKIWFFWFSFISHPNELIFNQHEISTRAFLKSPTQKMCKNWKFFLSQKYNDQVIKFVGWKCLMEYDLTLLMRTELP